MKKKIVVNLGLKFIVILTTSPFFFSFFFYDALPFKFEVHPLSLSLIYNFNALLSIIRYTIKGIDSLTRFITHRPCILLISPFK